MSFDLLGYDLETTSKIPETARVVQIAALLRNAQGEITPVINQLCNPGCDISDEASEIHKITQDMVADAEPDLSAMKRLYAYVSEKKDQIIVVGHNIIGYDLKILWTLGGPEIPVLFIDTFVAATRIFVDAESHKLSDLVQWLEIADHTNAHNAEADITMVFALCDYIFNGLKQSSLEKKDWTYKDFAEWCMTPRVLKRAHFGKHKGKLWGYPPEGADKRRYVPSYYVKKYIAEKWTDPTPDMIATLWAKYKLRFQKLRRA
jgi:DNA polymerase-3 subunit epsilon